MCKCVCVCVCVLYVCFRKDIVIRSLEWREGVSGVPNRHTSRKKHRQKLTHYTHTLSLAHTHTHQLEARFEGWWGMWALSPRRHPLWRASDERGRVKRWCRKTCTDEPTRELQLNQNCSHTRTHTPTWYSMYPHTAEPQTVSEVLQLIMHESVCGAGGGPVSRTAGPNEVGHVCLTPLPGSHE